MDSLRYAFYWAASCGGCEIAVLDIDEKILDVIETANIVFWPVAMDMKYHDIEAMPDKNIDVCFFNGAIRTEENEHMAKMLRKKSKTLVAFGSCAHEGGVIGLANLWNQKTIFERVYLETPSTRNPRQTMPKTVIKVDEGELTLPAFYDAVKTLDQTVEVDYYLPGCPPPIDLVVKALAAIEKGELPPKGSVLAPIKSICDDCPRIKSDKKISKIERVYEIVLEDKKCLLEQGIICIGPATRAGCGAQCLTANMPCTGCGGPCPNAMEQGAAIMSTLMSILGANQEKSSEYDVETLINCVRDPVGTFYQYSLPHSILRRRVIE